MKKIRRKVIKRKGGYRLDEVYLYLDCGHIKWAEDFTQQCYCATTRCHCCEKGAECRCLKCKNERWRGWIKQIPDACQMDIGDEWSRPCCLPRDHDGACQPFNGKIEAVKEHT